MKQLLNWLSLSIYSVIVFYSEFTSANDAFPNAPECGIYHENKIVSGIVTELDAYPWMVLLEYSKPNNAKGTHCAGILINKRYVLTTAHCVGGMRLPSTWNLTGVVLGENDILKENDCKDLDGAVDCNPPVIRVPISEHIIHESYNPKSIDSTNDIALLRLESDVIYSDVVKPICLPRDQKLREYNYDNVTLDAAGWYRRTNIYSVKLHGRVTVLSNAECNAAYKINNIVISDSQLCVKNRESGFDPCEALSGSPIMRLENSDNGPFRYLVGFVTFGPSPCGKEASPDVFTRIDSHIEWIESKVHA